MNSPSPIESGLAIGGPVSDSDATLCIYSADIDIPRITNLVGCTPSHAHRRGDQIGSRPPAKIGLWQFDSPRHLSFEEKLRHVLEHTTADLNVWMSLAIDHSIQLRCALYLHSWSEGFELPAGQTLAIGSRGWSFGLSVYGAEGSEVLEAFLTGEPLPGGTHS